MDELDYPNRDGQSFNKKLAMVESRRKSKIGNGETEGGGELATTAGWNCRSNVKRKRSCRRRHSATASPDVARMAFVAKRS